jgi:peptidyl-prolyl cis-trans isomerase C
MGHAGALIAFWRRVRGEPMAHFFLAAAAVFALASLLPDRAERDRRIVVDEAGLGRYLQQRVAGYTYSQAVAAVRSMTPAERATLRDSFVRDEVLYREALAIGLHRESPAVRAMMVRTLSGSLETAAAPLPSEAELRAYFAANEEAFRVEEAVSFSHVFLAQRNGAALDRASAVRAALLSGAESAAQGDLAPWPSSQVARSRRWVGERFGEDAASALFDPQARGGAWLGPFQSRVGTHFVRLEARTPAGAPSFESARQRVAEAWSLAARARADSAAVAELARRYRIIGPLAEKP